MKARLTLENFELLKILCYKKFFNFFISPLKCRILFYLFLETFLNVKNVISGFLKLINSEKIKTKLPDFKFLFQVLF